MQEWAREAVHDNGDSPTHFAEGSRDPISSMNRQAGNAPVALHSEDMPRLVQASRFQTFRRMGLLVAIRIRKEGEGISGRSAPVRLWYVGTR